MTTTPTPRTDALVLEINEGRMYATSSALAELARQLERENAALRAALRERQTAIDELMAASRESTLDAMTTRYVMAWRALRALESARALVEPQP